MTENELVIQNNELNFKRDIKYIKSDIIAKQVDGKLCKYSKVLDSIVVNDMDKSQYLAYWINKYKSKPEYLNKIKECCIHKLNKGLLSSQEMLELVKNSRDTNKEKIKMIDLLGGSQNG